MSRPKIGAVSYLNTKPLVEGMEALGDGFELVFDLPSRLADRLAARELVAALIPSIEAEGANYQIISDACIACRGPVHSVKLLGRVAPEQIQSLALDEGSRTSCALAQILLFRRFGIRPQTSTLKMQDDWRSPAADAVLIIGDRAMKVDESGFCFSWDLGEVWYQMTGLPFVFAVWAAPSHAPIQELAWLLSTCRDTGLENLDRIAARYASQFGLSLDGCLRYLRDHLHFEFGSQERAGLELFYQWHSELVAAPVGISD